MSSVVIKGTRDGVSIILGEGEWRSLLEGLAERLHTTASFFKGGRVTLEVGDRVLDGDELRELEEILSRYDMGLYAVSARSPQTRAAARKIDIRAVSGEPVPASKGEALAVTASLLPDQKQSDGVLVRRTVRSGQVIQHPGHVVVIGDVNPGSEIIAGGDVVIWGRLRGTVHAGALGDDNAVVCAVQMRPTQLRIGNHIARAPEERKKRSSVPEVAFVREGKIVAEPWDAVTLER